MTNRIRLLVVCFHECRKIIGKGKVRIVIELDMLSHGKGKEWGDTASAITPSALSRSPPLYPLPPSQLANPLDTFINPASIGYSPLVAAHPMLVPIRPECLHCVEFD